MTAQRVIRVWSPPLLATALVLTGCTSPGSRLEPAAPETRWGIRVEGVRVSAAGYMLDFRYRVLDAAKAAQVIRPGIKSYLVVEDSGARLEVPAPPKVGPLRPTRSPVIADKTYFMFFANPARRVRPGDRVAVVMGDVRAEHLVVQ